MKEQTLKNCEQLMENRDRVKNIFAWEGGMMHLCCAGIYSAKGLDVDENTLRQSKELMKHKISAFSNFRSTGAPAIAAIIASSGNPEQTLENGLEVYELLKKEFWGSTYLPLAAMIIAQKTRSYKYEQIASRTRAIYDRMKSEHPFLTSSEDSAFCALMALSEESEDHLIADMEACYQILKPKFFSANAVQSLSHVLALCEGEAEEKCSRTMELFDRLKAAGRRYGTDYELPTLGVLAMSGADLGEIVEEIIEIDEWLSKQKGFGIFGSVTAKQRLMYAGILAQRDYINEDTAQTTAVGSAIALIAAQEAAICAAIVASTVVVSTTTD